MPSRFVVLDPTAPRTDTPSARPWRIDNLQGKVVGFIDNSKPNFNSLVDELADVLVAQHGVARVVKVRKRAASVPADTAVLETVAKECDLVITGSGD